MKSTRPLAKTGTSVERLLLAAGADERPDAESVRRAARVLGLVPRAALVAATLGVALRGSRWTSLAMWGSVSLVGIAGISVVGYSARALRHGEVAPVVPAAPRAGVAPSGMQPPGLPALAQQASSAAVSATLEAPGLTGPLPPVEARGVGRRAVGLGAPAVDRLREQAEVLDGVRARLALGDAAGALAQLGDYDRRFAGGSLREESLLLRIEALVREGDGGAASILARRFLKTYPSSVHADRVATLLKELSQPRTP
jgi:hypothetical protein